MPDQVRGGRQTPEGSPAIQKVARGLGLIFLLLGVLGFVPGVTTNVESMSLASHHSKAMLLGIFQVSILQNIVHLLFGVAGLVLTRTVGSARRYLVRGGASYLTLFVYGLMVSQSSNANFVPVSPADDILHLLLGIAMIVLGLVVSCRIVVRPSRRGDAVGAADRRTSGI